MGYYKDAIGKAFNLNARKEIKIKNLPENVNEFTGNKTGIIFRGKVESEIQSQLCMLSMKKQRDFSVLLLNQVLIKNI
jgi:hypothetical protein